MVLNNSRARNTFLQFTCTSFTICCKLFIADICKLAVHLQGSKVSATRSSAYNLMQQTCSESIYFYRQKRGQVSKEFYGNLLQDTGVGNENLRVQIKLWCFHMVIQQTLILLSYPLFDDHTFHFEIDTCSCNLCTAKANSKRLTAFERHLVSGNIKMENTSRG